MTDTVISVEHLSKRYRLGQIGATTLRESVERWIGRLRRRPVGELSSCQVAKLLKDTPSPNSTTQQPSNSTTDSAELWALRDVSFEVKRGEVLGIIGRNGAGKSTLLKILTRITEPTSGRAVLRGRVASLLEVGTGFHPELTGRENVFLNGAILGMRKTEIAAKFDEIVAFAEVEKFIDTPVKRYSSGMYVRLAFAVAAHLDPEILLIDEVLAVGDAGFQRRCLGKMKDVGQSGRTIVFVSHNMTAMKTLCSSAIWLEQGCSRRNGPTEAVVAEYLQMNRASQPCRVWDSAETAPGDGCARLHRVSVNAVGQTEGDLVTVGSTLRVEVTFWCLNPDIDINVSCVVYTIEGICMFNTGSPPAKFPRGLVRCSFEIPHDFLNSGAYSIRVLLVKDGVLHILDVMEAVIFEVHDVARSGWWHGSWIGVIRPHFEWNTEVLD